MAIGEFIAGVNPAMDYSVASRSGGGGGGRLETPVVALCYRIRRYVPP